MATDQMPDCGNPDCPQAVVVWRDGKRYIEWKGEYQPFDSFVRVALQEILNDLDAIKVRLDDTDKYKGLVP